MACIGKLSELNTFVLKSFGAYQSLTDDGIYLHKTARKALERMYPIATNILSNSSVKVPKASKEPRNKKTKPLLEKAKIAIVHAFSDTLLALQEKFEDGLPT